MVTVSGAEIPNATVVISAGKITAVGANAAVPANAQVIDATGLMVYPGMIETGSTRGKCSAPHEAHTRCQPAAAICDGCPHIEQKR